MLKELWGRLRGNREPKPKVEVLPADFERLQIVGAPAPRTAEPPLTTGDKVIPFNFGHHAAITLRRGTIYQIREKKGATIFINNLSNGKELKKGYPEEIFRRSKASK